MPKNFQAGIQRWVSLLETGENFKTSANLGQMYWTEIDFTGTLNTYTNALMEVLNYEHLV